MIEGLLNRFRGTIGAGAILYAVYLGFIITVISGPIYGVLIFIAFMLGESFAWGKWVGYLVDYENTHEPEYTSKVGKSFPYIHYIADVIISEKKDYKKYCQLALAIRGFLWFLPVYSVLGLAGLSSWYTVIICSIIIGLCFPIACELGKNWDYNKEISVITFKRGWENQEVIYGVMQGIIFWFMVIL